MSHKHPIIAITGSSGAGTTTIKDTFEKIFKREGVTAAFIEGDAFHRYDRIGMKEKVAEEEARGNDNFSHFSPEANELEILESVFEQYGRKGTGKTRTMSMTTRRPRSMAPRPAHSPNGRTWSRATSFSTKACMAA